MSDLTFSYELTPRNKDHAVRLLRADALSPRKTRDYPGNPQWAERSIEQIVDDESKHAIVSAWGRHPLGLLVLQPHPHISTMAEVRNITTRKSDLPIGQCLLSMAPRVAAQLFPDAEILIGDTKITNTDMINIAIACGWSVLAVTTLVSPYGHNRVPDVVMTQPVKHTTYA